MAIKLASISRHVNITVEELQRLLNLWDYDLKADGIIGPKTTGAVLGFQTERGLVADGAVGVKTLKALKEMEKTIEQGENDESAASNANMVSEHFSWDEAQCPDGAPFPEKYRGNATELAIEALEPIRERCGSNPMVILSWYRSPDWNKKRGGAPNSRHMYGGAADFRIYGVPMEAQQAAAEEIVGRRGGVGKYAGRTHVDLGRGEPDMYGRRRRW